MPDFERVGHYAGLALAGICVLTVAGAIGWFMLIGGGGYATPTTTAEQSYCDGWADGTAAITPILESQGLEVTVPDCLENFAGDYCDGWTDGYAATVKASIGEEPPPGWRASVLNECREANPGG